MEKFDYFVYFILLVRICSVIIGISIEYHTIIDKKFNTETTNETVDHGEKVDQNKRIRSFLDFLFNVLFGIFIFIVFKTGIKEVRLDFKQLLLLKFAAFSLIVEANWESLFVFIYPALKRIEYHIPI
jgi:hypothetical protein